MNCARACRRRQFLRRAGENLLRNSRTSRDVIRVACRADARSGTRQGPPARLRRSGATSFAWLAEPKFVRGHDRVRLRGFAAPARHPSPVRNSLGLPSRSCPETAPARLRRFAAPARHPSPVRNSLGLPSRSSPKASEGWWTWTAPVGASHQMAGRAQRYTAGIGGAPGRSQIRYFRSLIRPLICTSVPKEPAWSVPATGSRFAAARV